jgi:hypothetical protein
LLGASAARLTVDTKRFAQILSALDIDDVSLPQTLDGKSATIHISPAVRVKWQLDTRAVELLQSPSPQVNFPPDTNLAALGEIGLRVLGLPRNEAYRLAQSLDWRTTLLVPIPPEVASFRQVSVQGGSGLLLELAAGPAASAAGTLLLWSNGTQVFQLRGNLSPVELLEIAQTLQ